MASEVQRFERTRMVLPLRVWVGEAVDDSAQQLAHTIDISPIGGRLGGLRAELFPGQTITVQRGQKKAAFRVVWNTCLAPGEYQAGIEALGAAKNIWGVELPQASAKESLPSRAKVQNLAPIYATTLAPLAANIEQPMQAPATSRPVLADASQSQKLWAIGAGLLLVASLAAGLYWHHLSSARLALHSPAAPAVPTAAELAAMAPKPRVAPLADEVTTWHSSPVPLVKVAEAPTERMVYPVSPNVRLSGTVNLDLLISTDGRVKQVRVLSGKQPLVQAAALAARQWRYSPYAVKGEPAEGEANVVVAFRGADAVSLEFPSGAIQGSKN